MATISENKARLDTAKANLKASINAKGGTLTTETLDQYYTAVDSIQTGDDYVVASNYCKQLTGTISSRVIKDTTHLYYVSYSTGQYGMIVKVNLSSMAFTYSSAISNLKYLTEYGDYIYAAVGVNAKKYDKATLSLIDSTGPYGGAINAIVNDGTYLYIGGVSTKKIYKYSLSDLTTKVAESSALASDIRDIVYDNNKLYVMSGAYIYAYDTATLTLQTTSRVLSTTTTRMRVYGDYIYISDNPTVFGNKGIYRLDTTTLNDNYTLLLTENALRRIDDFYIADNLVYMVGTQSINNKYLAYITAPLDITSYTEVQNGIRLTLNFNAIYVDTTYIYLGYSTSDAIIKIAKE